MFGKNKDLYGWIDEQLNKEFKEKSKPNPVNDFRFPIGNEQLSSLYLRILKDEGATNEEIYESFNNIFKGIAKKEAPHKPYEAWCGYNPSEYLTAKIFNAIIKDINIRAFNNMKDAELMKHFVDFDSNPSKWDLISNNSSGLTVISSKPELGASLITEAGEEGFSLDCNQFNKLFESYSNFKQFIEILKVKIDRQNMKLHVITTAIICSNPIDNAFHDAFVRGFGDDKKFEEEYYELFKKYYKIAQNMWPNVIYYNPYDYLIDDKVSESYNKVKNEQFLNEKKDESEKSKNYDISSLLKDLFIGTASSVFADAIIEFLKSFRK